MCLAVGEAGISDYGRLLLSGSWDYTIKLWDTRTSTYSSDGSVLTMRAEEHITALSVNPYASPLHFASGCSNGDLQVWDIRHPDKPLSGLKEAHGYDSQYESHAVWALHWRDRHHLISSCPYGRRRLCVWDAAPENLGALPKMTLLGVGKEKLIDAMMDDHTNKIAVLFPTSINIIGVGSGH